MHRAIVGPRPALGLAKGVVSKPTYNTQTRYTYSEDPSDVLLSPLDPRSIQVHPRRVHILLLYY